MLTVRLETLPYSSHGERAGPVGAVVYQASFQGPIFVRGVQPIAKLDTGGDLAATKTHLSNMGPRLVWSSVSEPDEGLWIRTLLS